MARSILVVTAILGAALVASACRLTLVTDDRCGAGCAEEPVIGAGGGDGGAADGGARRRTLEGSDERSGETLDIFGLSTSARSLGTLSTWAPTVSSIGVRWVRGFDTFGGIEPEEGRFDFTRVDAQLAAAEANGLSVSGLFFYGVPWLGSDDHTFPSGNLPAWSAYVTAVTEHCKGRVRFWEVWNEPPNFTAGGTPEAYAALVRSAYDAAKAVDPTVSVGLAAQSNNVVWLEQTILAGAAGHYDYITVHPYEVLGVVHAGAEAQYLSIVPGIRKMLAVRDPARVDVPVWFTEVGEEIGFQGTTASSQAASLVKAFAMGAAQGVARINWFEAVDGDSGPFGLIDGDGSKRPAFTALATMIEHLDKSRYAGWVLLNDKHYGFVFDALGGPVMATWSRPGPTDMVTFDGSVTIVDPLTGARHEGSAYELSGAPVLVLGVPPDLVARARANRSRPVPWDGDYTQSTSATVTMGAPNMERGLHQLGAEGSSELVTVDGVSVRDCSKASAQVFTVDPSFLSYTTVPIRITAVVRRVPDGGAAGFNLKYESTSGIKSTGAWFGVPEGEAWTTQTWTLDDAELVGKWGYHFMFDSDSAENARYQLQSVTITKL